jgi:hypothetical protein
VVLVFAFLIIPATVSALFTAHLGRRLLITWSAGALGAALGLVFADRLDFSVGPAVALFLGVELALAGLWHGRSRLAAGAATAAVVLAYTALLVAAPSPRPVRRDLPEGSGPSRGPAAPSENAPAPGSPSAGRQPDVLEKVTRPGDLVALFEGAPDPKTRRDVVLRALETEPRCGVHLALRFLRGDPPLFFRQSVVDGLGDLGGGATGWDVMQPFEVSVNAEAAARLKEEYGLGGTPPPCP